MSRTQSCPYPTAWVQLLNLHALLGRVIAKSSLTRQDVRVRSLGFYVVGLVLAGDVSKRGRARVSPRYPPHQCALPSSILRTQRLEGLDWLENW